MKHYILFLCLIFSLATLFSTTVHAETRELQKILETLRKAKNSPDPLPLLEKALGDYKKFRTDVSGYYVGNTLSNNAATQAHKEAAINKLQDAIDEAKAGKNPGNKISAALAEIHSSDQFRH